MNENATESEDEWAREMARRVISDGDSNVGEIAVKKRCSMVKAREGGEVCEAKSEMIWGRKLRDDIEGSTRDSKAS